MSPGHEWDEKGVIYPPCQSWHRQPGPGELGWAYPYYETMLEWKSQVRKECIREWLIAEQKKAHDKQKD